VRVKQQSSKLEALGEPKATNAAVAQVAVGGSQ
jgi:hypothetical protein